MLKRKATSVWLRLRPWREVDEFVHKYPTFLPMFAVGNAGICDSGYGDCTLRQGRRARVFNTSSPIFSSG